MCLGQQYDLDLYWKKFSVCGDRYEGAWTVLSRYSDWAETAFVSGGGGGKIFGFEVMHQYWQLVLLLRQMGVHPVFFFWGRDSCWSCGYIQDVPLATELGVSLIILTPMEILQQNRHTLQTHSSSFLIKRTYSYSNFVAISLLVLELLKKCRVR